MTVQSSSYDLGREDLPTSLEMLKDFQSELEANMGLGLKSYDELESLYKRVCGAIEAHPDNR